MSGCSTPPKKPRWREILLPLRRVFTHLFLNFPEKLRLA